jgi:hypothetical protein
MGRAPVKHSAKVKEQPIPSAANDDLERVKLWFGTTSGRFGAWGAKAQPITAEEILRVAQV